MPSTNFDQGSLRPTPRGATHPKLATALARVAAADLGGPCAEPPPPALRQAIAEFNAGAYFEQHETLELLWRATDGEVRHLYEGVLQVGVGLYHLLERGNYHGATVKLDHGIRLLDAFPPVCQGVDVASLRQDAARVRDHLLALGPEHIDQFDRRLVPRVHLAQGAVLP